MTEYNPDCWVMLKMTYRDEVFYKVLGGWVGGYLYGDFWRLNSGVERVELIDGMYHFHGSSGSVYKCNPDTYGLRVVTANILNEMKSAHPDVVELLDDCDWTQFDFGVKQ